MAARGCLSTFYPTMAVSDETSLKSLENCPFQRLWAGHCAAQSKAADSKPKGLVVGGG